MTTMNVCEGPIVLSHVTGNSASGNGNDGSTPGGHPGLGSGGAPAAKYNGFYSSYSEDSEW